MSKKLSLSPALNRATGWLSARLQMPDSQSLSGAAKSRRRIRLVAACAIIFLLALGVRLLRWQDSYVEIERGDSLLTGLVGHYRSEARRINEEGGILFPDKPPEPGDARMIVHPPGYSILLAALYGGNASGDSYAKLRAANVVCDAISAAVIFLIAAQMFPFAVAIIAGVIVALSPHLAHYSLWLSPDTLAALPVLFAVCCLVMAIKHPRLITIIVSGVFIGLSCWLRSNALLLAPFLAIVIFLLFERGRRLRYCAAMVCATAAIIAPITIRNWIVYHRFIPLSLGSGITLIEGIADYDSQDRFGLPKWDKEAALKDAEWYGRPEYASNLWVPDGIERDRARFARGLAVIGSNPGWFSGVMLERAALMLRSNDSFGHWRYYNIASAPLLSAEPSFHHSISTTSDAQPIWSSGPSDLIASGTTLSPQTEISLAADGQSVEVTGDASPFGDQFASAPIAARPDTDYILALALRLKQGSVAIRVMSLDRRFTLASEIVSARQAQSAEKAKRKSKKQAEESSIADSTAEPPLIIWMPFASGNRNEVRLVLSNNETAAPPITQLGEAKLFELGPTPQLWTRSPRALIRATQKNLFTTARIIPLALLGAILLAMAGRGRALVILLAVPLYYLSTQSALHTEYRYILAIHYFLFTLAAAAIFLFGLGITQILRYAGSLIFRRDARRSSGATTGD